MNAASHSYAKHADWKALYKAAISESDQRIVRHRVSEAENAVLAREREIFYSQGAAEEEETLEDALYALRAFETAWPYAEGADAPHIE